MSAPSEDAVETAVWALLGTLYYFAAGLIPAAVFLGFGFLASGAFLLLMAPVSYFAVPILLHVKRIPELAPEKAPGFRMGLWLFLGLSLLLPAALCSGVF